MPFNISMDELFSSTWFWIFFILCMAIKSAGGCKEKSDAEFHFIPLLESGFYSLLSVVSIIVAIIAVIVFSIKGEWWYSLIMIGSFFILAPLAVMITIEPVSKILGNIITNIQSNRRFFVDMDAARAGCGVSVWMIISILMEIIFSIWMIILFFL